jgi:NAD(P)-dependent dehydrogenase (short-subunit alcohol dehydrogenase family)
LVDIHLESAQRAADLIAERYPNVKALALKTDVGKEDEVRQAVDTTIQEFGRLDVMVSGFGISLSMLIMVTYVFYARLV